MTAFVFFADFRSFLLFCIAYLFRFRLLLVISMFILGIGYFLLVFVLHDCNSSIALVGVVRCAVFAAFSHRVPVVG